MNSKALNTIAASNILALPGLPVIGGGSTTSGTCSSDGSDGRDTDSNIAKSTEETLTKSSPSLIEKSNAQEKPARHFIQQPKMAALPSSTRQ